MAEEEEIKVLSEEVVDAILREKAKEKSVISTIPSYATIKVESEGAWKVVSDGETPVAVVWTDWNAGAGAIPLVSNEKTQKLRDYFTMNRLMGSPAGVAYSTSEGREGLEFSKEYAGLLEGAMEVVAQVSEIGSDNDSSE